jgi:hypothetical protein
LLTRPGVMAVVENLGARGATGVLEVMGDPAGAVYLDGGHIAFAEASWVPGLVDRLRGVRPSPAGLQELLSGWDAEDAAIAALVAQRGYLTGAGLHELIQSIVVDAFLVLMVPLPANSYVADIRFTSARTHAAVMFPRLDVDSVRCEAFDRAERMANYGLAPTTAVALRDLRQPTAVLTREQWAAVSQITENASARELARRHGIGLADMTECLGSLTRAGLCAPVRVSARRQQLAPIPGPRPGGRAGHPASGVQGAQGVQGVQGAQRVPRAQGAHSARRERLGERDGAPTADVLRQVLDGLRNLS